MKGDADEKGKTIKHEIEISLQLIEESKTGARNLAGKVEEMVKCQQVWSGAAGVAYGGNGWDGSDMFGPN